MFRENIATIIVWDITDSTGYLLRDDSTAAELIECLNDLCEQAERFGFDLLVPRGDGALVAKNGNRPLEAVLAAIAMYRVFVNKHRKLGLIRIAISSGKVTWARPRGFEKSLPFGIPVCQVSRLCDWSPRDFSVLTVSNNLMASVDCVLPKELQATTISLPKFEEPYHLGHCFRLVE
jgi:hypothetical protein